MGRSICVPGCLALILFSVLQADSAEDKHYQDIFRVLIPQPVKQPVVKPNLPKDVHAPVPVIPPLQVGILGIAGEEGRRLAILAYKGRQLLVYEGFEVKDEFKVIGIHEDKITFFHVKAGRRQEVAF